MASFVIGQPVTTAEPRVAVDPGLKPGLHRFRLEVVDDAGQVSKPDEALVQVTEKLIVPVTPILLNPIDPLHPITVSPLSPLRRPS